MFVPFPWSVLYYGDGISIEIDHYTLFPRLAKRGELVDIRLPSSWILIIANIFYIYNIYKIG
jgi:hypothetical protein